MALTTLNACKEQLDILLTDTSQDAYLQRLINSATAQVNRYCCRTFEHQSYTEIKDGSRTNELMLSNFPITAITSVHVDGARVFDADTLLPATAYAVIAPNMLRLIGSNWGRASQSIKIVYGAGYQVVPADVEDAAILLVETRYRMRSDRRLGRTSTGKQGESTSYTEDWPREILSLLDPYKLLPMVTDEPMRLV